MTEKSELVIIVDDDFRVRESISDLLASRNLASIAFKSAAEYLRFRQPQCTQLSSSGFIVAGHRRA